MIARVRNFLCKMDPILASLVIVVGSMVIGEAIWIGLGKFLLICLVGCILAALLFAIGMIVYKTIVLAQSHCK